MKLRTRRISLVVVAFGAVVLWIFANPESYETELVQGDETEAETSEFDDGYNAESTIRDGSGVTLAVEILERLEVKGRAPKTGYVREEFYSGWPTVDGCNLRQKILKREFGDSAMLDGCNVVAGEFDEPYTGRHMVFTQREEISKNIQIDHVVALSDAWQKGAQYLTKEQRYQIATDPLNLLAVDGPANEQKSDGDAATWLPSNKKFRCQYVARQVSVKYKYGLWVTGAEKEAIVRVLTKCPSEPAIGI